MWRILRHITVPKRDAEFHNANKQMHFVSVNATKTVVMNHHLKVGGTAFYVIVTLNVFHLCRSVCMTFIQFLYEPIVLFCPSKRSNFLARRSG
jgi:hypothetical protein